ncbi:MAG TPA: hypothetical protein VJB96_04555 [Patescibacteria group bacterium]|nr:hypothetical protein [Patescibacteria group bacterium]
MGAALERLLPVYPDLFVFAYGLLALLVMGLVVVCSVAAVLCIRILSDKLRKNGISFYISYVSHRIKAFRLLREVVHVYRTGQRALWRWEKRFRISVVRNPTGWMLAVLAGVLLTRLIITYGNSGSTMKAPESMVALPSRGVDLSLAVVKPLIHMLRGEIFYYYTANYGPSFTLFTLPFLRIAEYTKQCSWVDEGTCVMVLYNWLLASSVGGFALFIWLTTKRNQEDRNVLFLFFITFLLGIAGSLGLERGNIDILLALFFGMSIFGMKHASSLAVVAVSSVVAFLASSKLLFLPLAFLVFILSYRPILSIVTFAMVFFTFAYLPNLWGASSGVLDQFRVALEFEKAIPFASHLNILYNHSFAAMASMFTDCFRDQTCRNADDVRKIRFVSFVLAMFVFALPWRERFTANLWLAWRVLLAHRRRWSVMLLAIAYFVAVINLLPRFSFDYRLYFSLPIVIYLYNASKGNDRARYYCLLSMLFLGLKGLWIGQYIHPAGMNIFEARGLHFFVALHYFALIKSAILLWSRLLTSHARDMV